MGYCKAMVEQLVSVFVRTPASEEERLEISKLFEKRWNYQHALGALDEKHVSIRKTENVTSFYYSYKHTHYTIQMAIAGSGI